LSEPEGRAGLTDKLDADARIVQSPRPRESETDRYEGAVPVAVRLNCDNHCWWRRRQESFRLCWIGACGASDPSAV
jgi:hypothetical protein